MEPAVNSTAIAKEPRAVDDPRVYLAAERTYLAWVRTSISLMGFGFLIARFALLIREYQSRDLHAISAGPRYSTLLGFGMVCVGVAVGVAAALRHRTYISELKQGTANPALNTSMSMILAATLAVVGLAIAIHILTL